MLRLSLLDRAIVHLDSLLRSADSKPIRGNPAQEITSQTTLAPESRQRSTQMMRINHTGEVCAQALYQGQALVARSADQYNVLMRSAREEVDHLQWCRQRLQELDAHPSLLNPIWYAGSFAIGFVAGCASDKISLGFLAETEHQVTQHLEKHLRNLPAEDLKSRAILQQMRLDEMQHATTAINAGAVVLPMPVKFLMKCSAKVMTSIAGKI